MTNLAFQRKNGPFSHNLKWKDIICTKGKQARENPYQVINNDVRNLLHSTLSFAAKSFLLLKSWVIFVIQYYLDLHNQNWIKVWDLIILKKLYSYFVVPKLKKQKTKKQTHTWVISRSNTLSTSNFLSANSSSVSISLSMSLRYWLTMSLLLTPDSPKTRM